MCFILFRILQHDIRRKSPKRMCYHRFLLTNTFCINTTAACYLLRSFKCQKGQVSAMISISVFMVLFRIVFRIFVDFFVFVNFISFFCKSFRILFRICTHDRQKGTTHMDFISYFAFRMVFRKYFVCFSYCFVCFSYFVVSRILM